MVQKIKVEGYEAFKAKVAEVTKAGKTAFVLFSGTKDAAGNSWCPDCVIAEPVIDATFAKVTDDSVAYIYVGVGDRAFWKDPKCIFKTNPDLKLRGVPTLMKMGTAKRLDEDKHFTEDMINMLLEDD